MTIYRVIGFLAISVVLCSCAGKQQATAPARQEYAGISRIEGVSLETHEKVIATSNNAFASAWALESENSLPMDMGKIIGEYLYTVVPAI